MNDCHGVAGGGDSDRERDGHSHSHNEKNEEILTHQNTCFTKQKICSNSDICKFAQCFCFSYQSPAGFLQLLHFALPGSPIKSCNMLHVYIGIIAFLF